MSKEETRKRLKEREKKMPRKKEEKKKNEIPQEEDLGKGYR